MAKFFIDRPIFAIVVALVIVIVGAVAIPNLPIATYPEVVPPVVQVIANYRGGNSQDLEKTVAQPIEQQLVGLDGMLYFFSRSSNDGTLTIDVTYKLGSIPGVGDARLASQQIYGMRVWINPDKMSKLGLTATDVNVAIQAQNRQNPAGAIGQPPSPSGVDFQ